MNAKTAYYVAAATGLMAVGFGAFGAHGLKKLVDEHALATWETAVRYQSMHALALLAVAGMNKGSQNKFMRLSALFFTLGMVLFSGSLYLLSIRSLLSMDLMWLGPVTPMGGLSFLTGWLCLFLAGKEYFQSNS